MLGSELGVESKEMKVKSRAWGQPKWEAFGGIWLSGQPALALAVSLVWIWTRSGPVITRLAPASLSDK